VIRQTVPGPLMAPRILLRSQGHSLEASAGGIVEGQLDSGSPRERVYERHLPASRSRIGRSEDDAVLGLVGDGRGAR
jgi:hypothetical protein